MKGIERRLERLRLPVRHTCDQSLFEVSGREGDRCPFCDERLVRDGGDEIIYVVTCDDCGLYESYQNERIARGRKLSHWEDIQHVAEVEECGSDE